MADNTDKGSQETVKTLDEQINEVLATQDDKGQLAFSNEVDPVFKKLVLTEKKSRQHQAKAIKTLQENTGLKATNQVLEQSINDSTQITAEQSAELEDLKFTDPDAWFKKKSQYEDESKTASSNKLTALKEEASTKALNDLTLVERKEALAEFQIRTGIVLSDDVMSNDIPPRLQAKIADIPFDDYLNEVAKYLGKGKVVKPTDKALEQTNLGDLAGGGATKPTESKSYQIL